MPNWCANNVTIAHDDPAKLNELVDAYKRGELMEHYLPTPRDPDDPTKLLGEGKPILSFGGMLSKQGGSDWYSWRVNNWGTKWDVGGEDAFCERMVTADNTVVLSFDSAWSPPIEFYSFMMDQGFDIRASYFEPGMGFCGDWIDGMDNFYEGDWHDYPDHLKEEYNMDEFYEDEEEEVGG